MTRRLSLGSSVASLVVDSATRWRGDLEDLKKWREATHAEMEISVCDDVVAADEG